MNDYVSAQEYKQNIKYIIDKTREQNSHTEFILAANPNWSNNNHRIQYLDKLLELETSIKVLRF